MEQSEFAQLKSHIERLEMRVQSLEDRLEKTAPLPTKPPRKPKPKTMGVIDEFNDDSFMIEILKDTVPTEVQRVWVQIYEDPYFIKVQIKKAFGWTKVNPFRAPKSNWSKFYNDWLARSFEKYRKTIPSTGIHINARTSWDGIDPDDIK